MACTLLGLVNWELVRDDESYREYRAKFKIKSDDKNDGPLTALLTPGLPIPGSQWAIGNDFDPWAWCRWNAGIKPLYEGEACPVWFADFIFSNKPPGRTNTGGGGSAGNCREFQVEDPLLEPPKISGNFVRFVEEATKDRFGQPLVNSAWEQFRGPQVEFDNNRPTLKIEMNVPILNLPLISWMVDCVNIAPLWGLPARTIKLLPVPWERKFYGYCYKYFTVTFEFEINFRGWDRDILDEGTKVLNGRWNTTTGAWTLININEEPPDPQNPTHFIRFKDKNDENTRVILDGFGKPYTPDSPQPSGFWCINAASTPYCFLGDCEAAEAEATTSGSDFYGPFDTQNGCEQFCSLTGIVGDPAACATASSPGFLHVEKYEGANFLLLGIPLYM